MDRHSNHKINLKRIFGFLLLLAALVSGIVTALATLSFFGLLPPASGFGVTGIVAVILLSAWSCKRLLSAVSVGIPGRKGSISLSPLMDEVDTPRGPRPGTGAVQTEVVARIERPVIPGKSC